MMLQAMLEALVFASGEPLGLKELAAVLPDAEPIAIQEAMEALVAATNTEGRGLVLVQVGGRWQFRTDPRFGAEVLRLRGGKPAKLSKAALEALSVVAYQQPCTRHEVESLRGVDSGGVMKSLIDKGLLRVAGRRDEPGRPLEYRTTRLFLEMFSLRSLRDLPTLRERAALAEGQANDDAGSAPEGEP